MVNASGETVYLSSSAFKVGRGLGVVAQDVTERRNAEEALRRSNSMFEQAFDNNPKRMSRNYEGTGLGLPLCKSIMEAHGGSLKIESAIGAGTSVVVTFPARRTIPLARAS